MSSLLETMKKVSIVSAISCWSGVPTKLIRKVTLVQPTCPVNSSDYNTTTSRLTVHTLTFEIPQGHEFSGRAISHNDIRLDYGDVIKVVVPNYKPKSYSLSDLRPETNEMDITVKIYPNGRASGFLDRINVGGTMNSFGMKSGRTRNAGKFFGGIAYGVGITEILPLAEAELKKGDAEKVVILWASRTSADTFWLDRIARIKNEYGNKFEIIYMYSREDSPDPSILKGRINSSILKDVFESHLRKANISNEDARFQAIGTKELITLTGKMLSSIGFLMPKQELLSKI
mmetsp:Transcript_24846/g.23870  ORF Transcript_24846/g.23870 Transcript_24846/m.23870 type:complete len:287 (-) Transcript_24846:132-992(-)|eukprot:CAMPEP_0197833858 /NCGR_PEP_ID=MMETSP1437-20131217/20357_1 /TAXON_ID=49252 ORGANISM="Eucampia antarctica, Strain CCMP1452" /NCGR_SAMPLE_ID=MMETSP1437 /ASSEMBLY_ACC=CAM_ASM_001096 /LENGTH=286 /DNA_ID=CAMNT_0043438151 /DNA_START=27 /DNA_END=887 /DNA_ORIENTATION=-